MPDLGWDIAETQLQKDSKQTEVQESSKINTQQTALALQAMIAIAVIITTIVQHIRAYVQEIPEITRKAKQVVKSATTKISRNKLIQNIKKSYKTAVLAITIGTDATDHTSHMNQHQTANKSTQNTPGTQKLNDEYDGFYQLHTSRTHNDIYKYYN